VKGLADVSASPVSATCQGINLTPGLSVTKSCVVHSGSSGEEITFEIVVTNTGQVTVDQIYALDNAGTPSDTSDDIQLGPITLQPNQSYTFTGQYSPSGQQLPYYNGVTVLGQSGCPPVPCISQSAQVMCSAPAQLVLTKSCVVTAADKDDSKKITVFYTGTVTNQGTTPINNIYVNENTTDLSDSRIFGPYSLDVGASANFSGFYFPSNPKASNYTDTVFATGRESVTNAAVSATAVSATCPGIPFYPQIVTNAQCTVEVTQTTSGSTPDTCVPLSQVLAVNVLISGTVSNTGNVGVLDLNIVDDAGTPNNYSDDILLGPYSVDANDNVKFQGSYSPPVQNGVYSSNIIAEAVVGVIGYGNIDAAPFTVTCQYTCP